MPEFTTTEQVKIVASVFSMGSCKEYFGYTCYMCALLSSVGCLAGGVNRLREKLRWIESGGIRERANAILCSIGSSVATKVKVTKSLGLKPGHYTIILKFREL